MAVVKLETPLANILDIGPRFVNHLSKLKIFTVRDLIRHFPFRYEDFSQIYKISELEPNQQATIQGVIKEANFRRSWRRRMIVTEALISDESGSIRAVWFNQPYLRNILRPGRLVNLSGKVALDQDEIYLSHPAYEFVERRPTPTDSQNDAENLQRLSVSSQRQVSEWRHTGRLVPIYPETAGLTSKGLRFLIQPILKNLEKIPEFLPLEVLRDEGLPEINRAIKNIHFPEEVRDAEAAKKRFVFEDLFLLQLSNLEQKSRLAKERAPVIQTEIQELKAALETLPFRLTLSQKKSLWEIIKDLEKSSPMNRLLQGDVGSGKTVVATLAAMISNSRGFQTAFMAPTEVLARQHFQTLKKIFSRLERNEESRTALLTAASAKIFYETDVEIEIKKAELQKKIASGEIKIVIGTQALIQKSITFQNLGLVIVDEQHRFGVQQRAELVARGQTQTGTQTDAENKKSQRESALVPHFLSMSATPIPRTLMLTIFGDLDISTIDELPAGRKNIVTKIVDPANREKAYDFIRKQVKTERQAFVICPRIKPAEENQDTKQSNAWNDRLKLELKSVKEEYEKLSKKVFPDLKIAMLHGQMKSKDKEKVMTDFRDRKTDILVSTSVIEVGVDVPNATIMMIEGSERFGLAQLYQFRGRVGRGGHQSYCFLFSDSSGAATKKRLKAILEAKNGFELAENDLAIRGPGEFLGESQSGMPDLAMRGLQDIELVKRSRRAAERTLEKDQNLTRSPLLKAKITHFKKMVHFE